MGVCRISPYKVAVKVPWRQQTKSLFHIFGLIQRILHRLCRWRQYIYPDRTFIHEQFLSHSFRNLRRCVQKHKLLPKLPGHPHPSVTAVFPPYRQVFHRTGNPPRPCRRNDQTPGFHTIWASSSSISAASRTMMIHSRTCSCRAARYSPIRWPLIS